MHDMVLHAQLTETHISVLVFLGERAYKLKKPVRLEFLDYSTRELREAACHREVELNRRLAPDAYLGVADVTDPDGQRCDHLVVMRRMPPERRLAQLVRDRAADLPDQLDALAEVLARFHASAERGPHIDAAASPDAVAQLWDRNLVELHEVAAGLLDERSVDRAGELGRRFIAGRAPLFEERIAGGWICDGHGDLQAEDIFCVPEGPQILDCIDFDDTLRYGDVALDVAFLAMDLERLGAPDEARAFLHGYERHSGAELPAPLVHLYLAHRALVRAKVHCLRAREGLDDTSATQAAALVELARSELERGRSVVLDASWRSAAHRQLARQAARDTMSDLVELRCVAPAEIAAARITRRLAAGTGVSDATPAIAARMADTFDAWPEAGELDTSSPLNATIGRAISLIRVAPGTADDRDADR
jgi:hypothetical protein